MLKTRGGNRFEGYGNVKVATERGNRAGWQLVCYECQGLSDVIHRTGASFPPKVLTRMFSEKGWKVGNSSASDLCPTCVEKRRERHREERKQYAKGSVDRLLDTIRQVDLMLASSVTVDYGSYQPQIAAQLKSLFETAYLCNMLPNEQPASMSEIEQLRARQHALEAALDIAKTEYAELLAERDELTRFQVVADKVMRESETAHADYMVDLWNRLSESDRQRFLTYADLRMEPPPPEPPAAAPPPATPTPEGERMSPRTAAFLAEVRKQIFKGEAA